MIGDKIIPDYYLFTAKWDDSGRSHPLVYHLLDSGAVAELLWQEGLTAGARAQFSRWLGMSVEDAGRCLVFWTALHDIGKATPVFQCRTPSREILRKKDFPFPNLPSGEKRRHDLLSAWILDGLQQELGFSKPKLFRCLRAAIGGHHGTLPSNPALNNKAVRAQNLSDGIWNENRLALIKLLQRMFISPVQIDPKISESEMNACFSLLAGFIVAADWISSQDEYFDYCQLSYSPEDYLKEVARGKARHALSQSGWLGWQPDETGLTFQESFEVGEANRQQQAVFSQIDNLGDPFLMIVEAPTGTGKTEAALYVADYQIRTCHLRGLYVAMPTQATSNQMYERAKSYLARRFPTQPINLHLVHGNALLNEDFKPVRFASIADEAEDENREPDGVNAMAWFIPRKRTLLAPFGVGTVDQTFLSVLQTKHFFLRLFGLHRKVLIFDEVHAYDVYMVEIFKRLLAWLRAMGTSVIMLSATLPQKTRLELLRAYDPDAKDESVQTSFPRMSLNSRGSVYTFSLGEVEDSPCDLDFIGRSAGEVVNCLQKRLAQGGCAAVICNTVDRAQEIFTAIQNANLVEAEDLYLFHSRIPYCWRENLEKSIVCRFGKLKQAPTGLRRGIVVATQVIEQSLDLDFDLLITDLAPLDLLIQRIGRLHRHRGERCQYPPLRPPALSSPICVVCMPEQQGDNLAEFENDKCVYAEYTLQRSFFTLRQIKLLNLPSVSDDLIEAVYSTAPLPGLSEIQQEALRSLWTKKKMNEETKILKAGNQLVGDVDYQAVIGDDFICLAEDSPDVHKAMQVFTRDVRPTIQLVCLVKGEDGVVKLLANDLPFDILRIPQDDEIKAALRSIVLVGDSDVLEFFFSQDHPVAWRRSPQLRNAWPVVFDHRLCKLVEGLALRLDTKIGLRIEKDEK